MSFITSLQRVRLLENNMKIIQCLALFVGTSISMSLCASCLDADQARALYLRAKGQTADNSVQLLKRSAELCENDIVYYDLGSSQLKLKQYQNSISSYKNALRFVDLNSQLEAKLQGRMATSYYQLDDLFNALKAIKIAQSIYAKNQIPVPKWMSDIRSDIDFSLSANTDKSVISTHIRFASNSIFLDKKRLEQVNKLAKTLLPYIKKEQRFLVIGHTDLDGSQEYNQQLSVKRAMAVVNALESFSPELKGYLDSQGEGFKYSHGNKGKQNRQLNMRVVVLFL